MKIGILGAGSWGTALAMVLKANGHEVALWSISKEEVTMLLEHREHIKNLPGVPIDPDILVTWDQALCVKDKDMLVFAVPSKFVRSTARMMKDYITSSQILVNVAKGLEDGTLDTLVEILEQEYPENDVVVLSGPSHAEEVAKGVPTAVVVASHHEEVVKTVQDAFMNERFRVYGSQDVLGIEIGGALKNVIALAAGISDGLGHGDNTKAALMTRGMAEISRLGAAMGAQASTFNGLTGIGDLIVTCTSMHSRNRRAGMLIGQGRPAEEAIREVGMVVEGYNAAKAALALARKHGVEMPIIEQVNKVLFEGKSPGAALSELMGRDRKFESD